MTQEDKELFLKDLSARLPYKVKVCLYEKETCILLGIDGYEVYLDVDSDSFRIESIKPYLRPLSSMTDEEREEWTDLFLISVVTELEQYSDDEAEDIAPKLYANSHVKSLNWLNKHHFDYNGLIEKGLALEAPKGMYN